VGGGGYFFIQNMEIPGRRSRRRRSGGLCEIPSVVGV